MPIWTYTGLQLPCPFSVPSTPTSIPYDMLPHHILLWSHHPLYVGCLRRISMNCLPGRSDTKATPPTAGEEQQMRGIIGLRHDWQELPSVHEDSRRPKDHRLPDYFSRSIGTQHSSWDQKETLYDGNHKYQKDPYVHETVKHFDIDGEGGEFPTEVHVTTDVRALKLVTNLGRECQWGEEDIPKSEWCVQKGKEKQPILGLVVVFGAMVEGGVEKGMGRERCAKVSWITGIVGT